MMTTMRKLRFSLLTRIYIAIALSIASAAEITSTRSVTKTKDSRGKRSGASHRNDDYNYQPTGYNYEHNNYISGGSASLNNDYSHRYPEAPEPIIEIIIQDNNETLPAPQPVQVNGKKKKEQVQVFYVKYHKDEHSGIVIHDPIPALSPDGHQQEGEEYEDEPIIVTPSPQIYQKSTTLRTIIRPDSQQYESDSGVHVTFGSSHNHNSKSDFQIHDEVKVESAIRPVVKLPQNRIGPASSVKEKRAQPSTQNQGRVVNNPSISYNQSPQNLGQSPPYQRPHGEFNPQSNFVAPQNQGHLSHQLSLPSQDSSKPFHSNAPVYHHQFSQLQQNLRPQQPLPIPVNHQHQQIHHADQQQNILSLQQFNQPPQRLPSLQLPQNHQQQPMLRPPQRPAVSANFNQNQKPFNYHAHASQNVRFPNQPQQVQQQFQAAPQAQQQFQNPPQQQTLQRPQGQQLPVNRPPQNFHTHPQPLPPANRPIQQFNSRPFPSQQQFPPNQGPPPNFRPNQEHVPHIQKQSLQQHNQMAGIQNFDQVHNHNQNVFRGGLVQQVAPDLTSHQHQQKSQQQQPQQLFSVQEETFRQEQNNFIQNNFGTDVQVHSSVPKFEHHITETVNGPIFFHPTAVDMDKLQKNRNIDASSSIAGNLPTAQHNSQHRYAGNSQSQQQNTNGVSNHFSEVFPQVENHQKQFIAPSLLELNGRNNVSPEPRKQITARSTTPTPSSTEKIEATTTSLTTKKPTHFDLPDEVPDDLREQLLSSGILENAQISILDYDKIGDTSLQDLPQEHLANFFSAGGGAQIGASNKVISVLKPNGDSIDEKLKSFQNDKEVIKILKNAKKLPAKEKDDNLRVVKYDTHSEKVLPGIHVQQNSRDLSAVNKEQTNYNRYLPLKINGVHFPISDVKELQGRIISSVVVLAPVNENNEEVGLKSEDTESKAIKFVGGDSLKNVMRKPSKENFKKWLEKEQKTNPDSQSVILLVIKDNNTAEQEIFMYDVLSKTVNRLSGEISSKFVDVAEENIFDDETAVYEQVDRIDDPAGDDVEAEASSNVESVVKLDLMHKPITKEPENKIVISSGYSVIKNK